MKLKAQLLEFMSGEDGWVHGGTLEAMRFPHPRGGAYKPSTVSRQMRQFAEEGLRIERKEERGQVLYRYIPSAYELIHKERRD